MEQRITANAGKLKGIKEGRYKRRKERKFTWTFYCNTGSSLAE